MPVFRDLSCRATGHDNGTLQPGTVGSPKPQDSVRVYRLTPEVLREHENEGALIIPNNECFYSWVGGVGLRTLTVALCRVQFLFEQKIVCDQRFKHCRGFQFEAT